MSRVHVVRSSVLPLRARYTVCWTGSAAPGRGGATTVSGSTRTASAPIREGWASSAA
jgi:hypothetical protein